MMLMPVYGKVVGGERERAERLCLSTESTEDHWPGASTAVELLKQSDHSVGVFFYKVNTAVELLNKVKTAVDLLNKVKAAVQFLDK